MTEDKYNDKLQITRSFAILIIIIIAIIMIIIIAMIITQKAHMRPKETCIEPRLNMAASWHENKARGDNVEKRR